jgi:DNA-binding transcriptional LysR family regulator
MTIDLADLRFIRAIVSASSLAAAARALNVTPPAVSYRLAQLELRLRMKLVERGAGFLRFTNEGELLASRAEVILKEFVDLEEDLAERRGAISGSLRVMAPFGFGRLHVAPLVASFIREHPEVKPTLLLVDDTRGALRSAQWDVLICVGRVPDSDYVQRKLLSNRRLICASPEYLQQYGVPSHPRELRDHHCGVIREDQEDVTLWALTGPSNQKVSVRIDPRFASNDGEVIRSWALDGFGIIERSEWSVADDIAAGRLVHLLTKWSPQDADVVIILNPKSTRARRVEAFITHLEQADWRTKLQSS